MSAIQSLASAPSHTNHSLALHFKILTSNNQDKRVRFTWVPSHVGITDNEKVDKSAKQAIDEDFLFQCLPVSEIYHIIKQSSIDDWIITYPSSFRNTHSWYLKIQS